MNTKKTVKIAAAALAVLLLAVSAYFLLGFYGNPVKKWMAGRDIDRYVRETYPQHPDLAVGEVHYSFKTGRYEAEVRSAAEPDVAFDVSWKGRAPLEDNYAYRVAGGQNTLDRLFAAAEKKLEAELSPLGALRVFLERTELPPFPLGTPYSEGLIPASALTAEMNTAEPGAELAAELIPRIFSLLGEEVQDISLLLTGEEGAMYNVFSVSRQDGLDPDLLGKIREAEDLFRKDSRKSLESKGIRIVVSP